jgi:DNA phosphorothioation-dependent restriction protein DptG
MSVKTYDRIPDYIESLFNVFQLVNKRSEKQQDKRSKMIALMIYNYIRKLANDNDVDLKDIKEVGPINLIPIFEYISYNNIELYDFSKIDIADVDVSKNSDLERFVLTHIYYITQTNV